MIEERVEKPVITEQQELLDLQVTVEVWEATDLLDFQEESVLQVLMEPTVMPELMVELDQSDQPDQLELEDQQEPKDQLEDEDPQDHKEKMESQEATGQQ